MRYEEKVNRRMKELSQEWNGDFEGLVRELVSCAGKDEQENYKLWRLTDLLVGQDRSEL